LKHEKALYQKNRDEFQLLQGEVTEKENELEAISANLLPAHSSKKPEELILTTVIREGLGLLVEEGIGIETTLSNIETKQQDNGLQLAEAEEMLVELPESVAIGDLQLAIKDAERVLLTEQEIDQLRQQFRDLKETSTNTACQLGLTLLDENQLLALSIPSTEKITALKTTNEKLIEEEERVDQAHQGEILKAKNRSDNIQYSGIMVFMLVLVVLVLMNGRIHFSERMAGGLVFFTFLLLFEFSLVLLDPYIEEYSSGAPVIKLAFNALLAAFIFPLHSFFESILKRRLVR